MRTIVPLTVAPEPTAATSGWFARAACRGHDPERWFADDDVGARAICRSCPVSSQCLDYALAQGIDVGVWGGLTAEDRAVVAAARGIVPDDPPDPGPRRCSCGCGRLARPSRRLASACQQRELRASRR